MKKLLIVYVSTIALIFILPVSLSLFKGREVKKPPNNNLPKTIKVYFDKDNTVREINFEDYIKGVLPAEMPASFNKEALKAQAVAARTYSFYKYSKFADNPSLIPPEHHGAAVCTKSSHCEAYYTTKELEKIHGKAWMKQFYPKICAAVDETRGEILEYDSKPILAAFHSASAGGRTENGQDVWSASLPYLVSVKTEGETEKPGFYSTVTVSEKDFVSKLKANFNDINISNDKSTWFKNLTKTEGNEVKTIDICGKTIKGTKVREMFSLKSACFKPDIIKDEIVFTVEGSGHGVGMSQYGANYMAEHGSSYEKILTTYYKGAVLVK